MCTGLYNDNHWRNPRCFRSSVSDWSHQWMSNHGGSNKNCSWAVNSSPKSHLCFLAYCLETQRSRPLSFWFCPISISPDSLKIFEIKNASPSFSIIYWIMLFWNYWTTQNYTENCLLCLWLKYKKASYSDVVLCAEKACLRLFFFSEKRGFEAFSYLAWHYCEQRDSVRQSLKAGVTGLKRETPWRMSKLHFGVFDYTWNQLER